MNFWVDEGKGDDVKLLGAYSSMERARDRIERAAQLDGFRQEPKCFRVDEYEIDKDYWVEGFGSVLQ